MGTSAECSIPSSAIIFESNGIVTPGIITTSSLGTLEVESEDSAQDGYAEGTEEEQLNVSPLDGIHYRSKHIDSALVYLI